MSDGSRGNANADLAEPWHLGSGRILVNASCWRGPCNAGKGGWIARDKPPYDAKRMTLVSDVRKPR